jgi:hypothetical protein
MRAIKNWLLSFAVVLSTACGSNDDSGELRGRVEVSTQEIEAVAITGAAPIFSTGEDLPLQLQATNASGIVTTVTRLAQWSSSDTAIATIDQDGVALGISDGTVELRAVYGPFADVVSVQVSSAPLESIAITAPLTQPNECTSQQLVAMGTYQGDGSDVRTITNAVEWQVTGGADIASFNQQTDPAGLLRISDAGNIEVTARFDDAPPGVLSLEALSTLDAIQLSPSTTQVTVGVPLGFRALGSFSDGGQNVDITNNANWSLPVNEGTAQFANVSDTLPTKGIVNATQSGGGVLTVTCGDVTQMRDLRAELPPTLREVVIRPEEEPLVVDVDLDSVQLQGIVRFSDNTEEDISELADWSSTGDIGALDLSDSSGSRGLVTVNGVGEIVVTMEYDRDGVVITRTITVRSEVR